MGCDWYNIVSVSGVGFSVTDEQYQQLKDRLGAKYGCLIYSENCDDEYLFIYDKETVTLTDTRVPGPYEIDKECLGTELLEHKHMVKFFQERIDDMKALFNLDDNNECSYWSILTTMGIGEFESYLFKVNEYRIYHGYDNDDDDDDDDE